MSEGLPRKQMTEKQAKKIKQILQSRLADLGWNKADLARRLTEYRQQKPERNKNYDSAVM